MPPPPPSPTVLPCPVCSRGMLQWTQVHLVPQPGRVREHVDVACTDANCGAAFDWVRGGWEVPDTLELKTCHDRAALKANPSARPLKDWFPPGTEGEIVPAGSAPTSPGWPAWQALAILLFAALLIFGHFARELAWGWALLLSLGATGLVATIYVGLRAAMRGARPDGSSVPPPGSPPGPPPGPAA